MFTCSIIFEKERFAFTISVKQEVLLLLTWAENIHWPVMGHCKCRTFKSGAPSRCLRNFFQIFGKVAVIHNIISLFLGDSRPNDVRMHLRT